MVDLEKKMDEGNERLLLSSDEQNKGEVEVGEKEGLRQRIWKENKKLWIVAGPAIFSRFSTFGVSFITQAFIGHVGRVELAAYALVFTVLTRFANGVLVLTPLSYLRLFRSPNRVALII